MSDNRFAYMRKHLGISQKDASEMFNTRLDTIKKWDNGRLFTPEPVLEELYELISYTNGFISEVADEYQARDEDDCIPEILLHTPSRDDMIRLDMPPSIGWMEHVIGALMGKLSTHRVYGGSEIPEHYEVDFQWYDFWEGLNRRREHGDVFVEDEKSFAEHLRKQIKFNSFDVRFDQSNDYFFGFNARTSERKTVKIWIKVCSASHYAEEAMSDHELHFHTMGGEEDLPFIEDKDVRQIIGMAPQSDAPIQKEESDAYSLAELIFEELRKTYQTNGDMLEACREKENENMGGLTRSQDRVLREMDLKDKYFPTHNFLVSLYLTVQKDTGLYLYPEAISDICNIITRSEPVMYEIDQQALTIQNDNLEVTILLDLRDVLNADNTSNTDSSTEFRKAIEVIKSSVSGCEVAVRPAFSRIDVAVLEETMTAHD